MAILILSVDEASAAEARQRLEALAARCGGTLTPRTLDPAAGFLAVTYAVDVPGMTEDQLIAGWLGEQVGESPGDRT